MKSVLLSTAIAAASMFAIAAPVSAHEFKQHTFLVESEVVPCTISYRMLSSGAPIVEKDGTVTMPETEPYVVITPLLSVRWVEANFNIPADTAWPGYTIPVEATIGDTKFSVASMVTSENGVVQTQPNAGNHELRISEKMYNSAEQGTCKVVF